jgi:hypothetical protein
MLRALLRTAQETFGLRLYGISLMASQAGQWGQGQRRGCEAIVASLQPFRAVAEDENGYKNAFRSWQQQRVPGIGSGNVVTSQS